MKNAIQAVVISSALALTSFALAPPTFAQGDVVFRVGDVTVAYRDGYWDRDHHWHKWQHESDWRSFKNTYPANYRDYNHDRDERDHGH